MYFVELVCSLMYSSVMTENRTAEGPKVVRVAINLELRDRINEMRAIERRNMTNAVEVLLIEALDARDAAREGKNR